MNFFFHLTNQSQRKQSSIYIFSLVSLQHSSLVIFHSMNYNMFAAELPRCIVPHKVVRPLSIETGTEGEMSAGETRVSYFVNAIVAL